MHSSGMRIARLLTISQHALRGGWVGCIPACTAWGVGGGCIPACTGQEGCVFQHALGGVCPGVEGVYPCEQNDRQV